VLPPTREPGLWAGDSPQASKGAVPKPVLLGVELPLPDGATSDEHSYPVRLCGQALSAAVAHLDIIPHGPRFPAGASRECAAAALLLQCLTEDLDELLKAKQKALAVEPGLQDAYDRAQAMAWNFFSAKCGKRRTTQEEIDYYDHVLTEWRTLKRNVQ
jgi:hypothetical protein